MQQCCRRQADETLKYMPNPRWFSQETTPPGSDIATLPGL